MDQGTKMQEIAQSSWWPSGSSEDGKGKVVTFLAVGTAPHERRGRLGGMGEKPEPCQPLTETKQPSGFPEDWVATSVLLTEVRDTLILGDV